MKLNKKAEHIAGPIEKWITKDEREAFIRGVKLGFKLAKRKYKRKN